MERGFDAEFLLVWKEREVSYMALVRVQKPHFSESRVLSELPIIHFVLSEVLLHV